MRTLLLALSLILSPCLSAQTVHEVLMLNTGASGPMPFEPDYLAIEPGDSLRFIPQDRGHNVGTIKGFIPEGAERFMSKIDEDFTTRLDVEGWYGLRCPPHYSMGMVMLVKVGNPSPDSLVIPVDLPAEALQRFERIVKANVR